MTRKTNTREHDCAECGQECDCGAPTSKDCELCDDCAEEGGVWESSDDLNGWRRIR